MDFVAEIHLFFKFASKTSGFLQLGSPLRSQALKKYEKGIRLLGPCGNLLILEWDIILIRCPVVILLYTVYTHVYYICIYIYLLLILNILYIILCIIL